MKNKHLPLVDLLIGVYDLLASDDRQRQYSAELQRIAAVANIDEEAARKQLLDLDRPVYNAATAIQQMRSAMKRVEKAHGMSCQAAKRFVGGKNPEVSG